MPECDTVAGAGVVVAAAGGVVEAGGLDCANAGTIITEASNAPSSRLERMGNLQGDGTRTCRTRRRTFCSWNLPSSEHFSFCSTINASSMLRTHSLRPAGAQLPN